MTAKPPRTLDDGALKNRGIQPAFLETQNNQGLADKIAETVERIV
jgi:hypothetical protein